MRGLKGRETVPDAVTGRRNQILAGSEIGPAAHARYRDIDGAAGDLRKHPERAAWPNRESNDHAGNAFAIGFAVTEPVIVAAYLREAVFVRISV